MEDTKAIGTITKMVKYVQYLTLMLIAVMVIGGYLMISEFKHFPLFTIENVVTSPVTNNTQTVLNTPKNYFEQSFDVSALGTQAIDEQIRYGYELITQTSQHIGPHAADKKMQIAGNNLACTNCHLNAGTKAYAAPFIGITGQFPQFRGRENNVGSIEERINGCMTRSLNGDALAENSKEMRAMVAYMNWLSVSVPSGSRPKGSGFKAFETPKRKVNLQNGQLVFENKCVSCHGPSGQGLKNEDGVYVYPPLAGKDSYNTGAGMHRVLTAAQFIKSNMPLGASHDAPLLTNDEAFDVAGYINSFPRPEKQATEKDFPRKELKPMSTPYGPWADNFSAEQHKYGPFDEIHAYYLEHYQLDKTK